MVKETCTSDGGGISEAYRSPRMEDIRALLEVSGREEVERLFEEALAVTTAEVGPLVYFRGIIEFSNRCGKNCYYCGIRKGNSLVERYRMSFDEIIECAEWTDRNGYGSIVLQSGEEDGAEFIGFVEKCVYEIKRRTSLGITLCVGEQTRDTYKRFFDAGAHRYLLRIETSNPDLYARLHPCDHSFGRRIECLDVLKDIGYQVGTGVMIGLPHQTSEDLANDVLFFRDRDIDMIGMGPFIPHDSTPLGSRHVFDWWKSRREEIFEMSLKMIAVTRLVLRDVNIAATTALQALHPFGREMGLKAGANIIMPVITPRRYRKSYLLYEGKPCIDDTAEVCRNCLSFRVRSANREIGWGEWGDSPHFMKKTELREG